MPNTNVPANGRAMPNPRLRRRMEAAIETLLATLDALDGDTDFEPANDDEPNLGWNDRGLHGDNDDREADDDDREPDVDDELTSGWENEGSQAVLRADDDREPSLGWTEYVDQSTRGMLVPGWLVEDGEEECEDEGAQCDDEGAPEYEGTTP